jgi:uncharacterized protein
VLSGRATPQATRKQAGERVGYRLLGRTNLTVSCIGFGGYRTGRTDPAHRAALQAALTAGVNLIDTSSNYMLGESERLVGEVLAEGIVSRDRVVVVTKIGYVQGTNLELAQEREAAGRPFPEMVKYMDGCWHCISPEFLEDQLARAFDRLGLETIDVLLLHNPEYFLSDAAHRSPDAASRRAENAEKQARRDERRTLEETREAFYDRLGRAFEYLDEAMGQGRIGAYGVSSNTCVVAADDAEATSVVRMFDASHGRMALLQLPYNLLETGALLERNTPDGAALEAAAKRDLGVLVNRPLNATGPGGRLVRLADPPRPGEPTSDQALRTRLRALGPRETSLGDAFPGVGPPQVAALLNERWDAIQTPQGCMAVVRGELIPEARRALGSLIGAVGGRPSRAQAELMQSYQQELNGLLERLQARAQASDPRLAASIRAALEPHLPLELRSESLSRLAMSFVASSPGVSCVLNGMRDPSYVTDAVGVMALPPFPDVFAAARALS